jgi:ABC-2 type transport system ATP-binding protein
VNHGQIVYQDKVSALKRNFLTDKQIDVRYAEQLPVDFHLDGVEIVKQGTYGAKLRVDTKTTPVERMMAQLAGVGSLVDVTISDPSLEEVIRTIYEQTAPTTTQENGRPGDVALSQARHDGQQVAQVRS